MVYLFRNISMAFEFSFEKLEVWRKSKDLLVEIYKLTADFPSEEKYGLVSQMRRSCLSISSNLAEGSARKSFKDKAHFTLMAFSSAMELLNQLIIAKELDYLEQEFYDDIRNKLEIITNMLNGLRNSQINK